MEKEKISLIEVNEDERVTYYNSLGGVTPLSASQCKFIINSFKALNIELPGKCEYRQPRIGEHFLDFSYYTTVCAEEKDIYTHYFVISSCVVIIG